MGLDKDIMVDEQLTDSQSLETGSKVESSGIKAVRVPDKGLEIISRVVVERLLPYFVDKERPCPRVVIREVNNASSTVALNDYLGKENSQIEIGRASCRERVCRYV